MDECMTHKQMPSQLVTKALNLTDLTHFNSEAGMGYTAEY